MGRRSRTSKTRSSRSTTVRFFAKPTFKRPKLTSLYKPRAYIRSFLPSFKPRLIERTPPTVKTFVGSHGGRYTKIYRPPPTVLKLRTPSLMRCARRFVRKQVMFATKKAGKSGQNRPKWTPSSYQRCTT